jgi:hypothetical protein
MTSAITVVPPELTSVVVVTGLSGAGKSTALNALEDLGYFCVDSLPTPVVESTLAAFAAAGVRRVVIVSEPYHLWRIERLVKMSGFDQSFDVQYAAAPTSCWRALGPFSKGALREPAAIINNAGHGYLF